MEQATSARTCYRSLVSKEDALIITLLITDRNHTPVRANMAHDLKESQRMTDEEVLGQITTFMLAGQETSSTALNWGLYMLSLHPDVQDKLRAELLSVQEDMPSMCVSTNFAT